MRDGAYSLPDDDGIEDADTTAVGAIVHTKCLEPPDTTLQGSALHDSPAQSPHQPSPPDEPTANRRLLKMTNQAAPDVWSNSVHGSDVEAMPPPSNPGPAEQDPCAAARRTAGGDESRSNRIGGLSESPQALNGHPLGNGNNTDSGGCRLEDGSSHGRRKREATDEHDDATASSSPAPAKRRLLDTDDDQGTAYEDSNLNGNRRERHRSAT